MVKIAVMKGLDIFLELKIFCLGKISKIAKFRKKKVGYHKGKAKAR